MAPPPPPPPPLTWVILGRVARRTDDEDVVPRGGGIRVEFARPPRITFLALPEHGQYSSLDKRDDPTVFIVAADRDAGLLLASCRRDLYTPPLGIAPPGTDLYVLSEDATVINIRTREALGNLGDLGLMALPGLDGCLVAELKHTAGSANAMLISFRSDSGEWMEREVPYPEAALLDQAWSGDGVFSHDGLLHWVDLRRGILYCNPLEEEPTLLFHSLPDGSVVDIHDPAVRATRCVNLSQGRMRFAEVRRDDGVGGAADICLWIRDGGRWRMEARVAFSEFWDNADDIDPEVVLVHPGMPVIYYYVEGRLKALDVRQGKVVEMEEAASWTSWRDVLPWELLAFVSPDRYPRRSGSIALVPGWETVHLGHAGPQDLLISAQPAGGCNTILHLRLWTAGFTFAELHLKMEVHDRCRVRIRLSATDKLLTATLPSSLCLISVPVPDFDCIFKAAGIRMEEKEINKPPYEATAFTGPESFRGCYTGDDRWMVEFVEMATPRGPVLLLRFHSPDWVSFRAQLLTWPSFHSLRITHLPDAHGYNIRFKVTKDSLEESVRDVRKAVRMVPLPCLSEICDAFHFS